MYEEEEDGNSAIPVPSPGLLVALLYVLVRYIEAGVGLMVVFFCY